MKKSLTLSSTEEQSKQFIEAARELECDESEERFDEALRTIAKAKPKPPDKGKPKPEDDQPGQ